MTTAGGGTSWAQWCCPGGAWVSPIYSIFPNLVRMYRWLITKWAGKVRRLAGVIIAVCRRGIRNKTSPYALTCLHTSAPVVDTPSAAVESAPSGTPLLRRSAPTTYTITTTTTADLLLLLLPRLMLQV